MSRSHTEAAPVLAEVLRRLDALMLAPAIARAEESLGAGTTGDAFRGLYVTSDEVGRLLARAPLETWLSPRVDEPVVPADAGALSRLVELYELDSFEAAALVIALAPELDLRYERVYAYLQDNVSRRRPTVELVLGLLSSTPAEALEQRRRFAVEAPLRRHGLVRLAADRDAASPSLLASFVEVDEQVVRFVLGDGSIDPRVAAFARLVDPRDAADPLGPADACREAARAAAAAARAHEPFRLFLLGGAANGGRAVAWAIACKQRTTLVEADLKAAPTEGPAFAESLGVLLRDAALNARVVFLDGLDALLEAGRARDVAALAELLADQPGATLLGSREPWSPAGLGRDPLGLHTIVLPRPGARLRREAWELELARRGLPPLGKRVEVLAARFRLDFAQIAEAAASAATGLRAEGGDRARPKPDAVLEAAFRATRAQSGHRLGKLATKLEPRRDWDDLVLPAETLGELRELAQRVVERELVLEQWGFDRKLSYGKGTTALFAGPAGTGKSLAAEVIANEVGLDLFAIDLSGVVSKWIGETEKNLDRIFDAAEDGNAILCFNEADALFGKRSEVSDAHDRYANIEVSYLLQRMESYEGLAILTTNLIESLDDAFVRRLAFTIHFPFPEPLERQAIWQRVWPKETPVDDAVDPEELAVRFRLSGGNIKNVALAASFLAAADGRRVTMRHVLHAVRREYAKLGKGMSEDEVEER